MSAALEVIHARDPKDELMERARPLAEHIVCYGDDALIAVYMRGGESGETRTKGGIIITSETTKEDEFQGKIGLLMKVGPEFYSKDGNAEFFGTAVPKVGDWVMFRIGDTFSFKIKKQMFRMCEAKMLRASVTKPDVIW